jgi:hypothetical protein
MRVIAAGVVSVLLFSSPAFAQGSKEKEAKHKSGTTKMWVGLGLVVIGGSMAATSHQSASTSVAGLGKIEASATSTGQLIAGLAIAGGGAYLLYDGLKERSEADKMSGTRVFVVTGTHGIGGFVRRTW